MTAVRRRRGLALVALAAIAVLGAVLSAGGGGDTPAGAGRTGALRATPATLSNLQRQYVRVVQAVSPQVVEVRTPSGLGSGVIFDGRGDVVTNAHVVGFAHRFAVTLAGGQKHAATLVGSDMAHDLAVVRLIGARPAPATFANSGALQVGDLVLAIGNPLGLRSSVTQGIVSSLGRTVAEGNGVTLSTVIQTSAAINPGNSGGALVDLTGQVVGIPTLAARDPQLGGGQAAGIGFAIPSSTVERVAANLTAGG